MGQYVTRKRAKPEADDLTFATMTDEASAPKVRTKHDADEIVDYWSLVVSECPCKASAVAHHRGSGGVVRVHVTAYAQPILCLPGNVADRTAEAQLEMPKSIVVHNAQWGIPIAYPWRKTYAYRLAEMSR